MVPAPVILGPVPMPQATPVKAPKPQMPSIQTKSIPERSHESVQIRKYKAKKHKPNVDENGK